MVGDMTEDESCVARAFQDLSCNGNNTKPETVRTLLAKRRSSKMTIGDVQRIMQDLQRRGFLPCRR